MGMLPDILVTASPSLNDRLGGGEADVTHIMRLSQIFL